MLPTIIYNIVLAYCQDRIDDVPLDGSRVTLKWTNGYHSIIWPSQSNHILVSLCRGFYYDYGYLLLAVTSLFPPCHSILFQVKFTATFSYFIFTSSNPLLFISILFQLYPSCVPVIN